MQGVPSKMANGHIPGRVNPFQQIGQTLAERQQQGLQAVQQILAGQTPQLPGLGAGWTPDFRATQQIIDAAISALRDDPTRDMSAFESSFVQPLLSSTAPGQLLALDYYTQKANLTGNLGSLPFTQLPGGSARAILAQSQALSRLGEQFFHDPRYQQMLGQFVSSLVPGGQAASLPTPLLSAVAGPYFQQLFQFGGDPAAAGLPAIQWPTSVSNIPLPRQNVIESIAEAALASQGQAVTPFGLAAEQPRAAFSRLIDLGLEAIRNIPGVFTGGVPSAAPAPSAGMPPSAMPVTAPAPAQAPTSVPQPTTTESVSATTRSAAVDAIKNTLSQMGASSMWALQSLQQNRRAIVDAIGEDGWSELWNWAQLNLPPTPNWMPPWGVDPIQAAIDALRRGQ